MASNREKKLKLFARDKKCHWCGRETILTSGEDIKGQPNPLMATVDHLYSRYNPMRWVKAEIGEERQVLACFECNNKRAAAETRALPSHIILKLSQGFSLNPRRKPLFSKGQESLDVVLQKMKEHGIETFDFDKPVEFNLPKELASLAIDKS